MRQKFSIKNIKILNNPAKNYILVKFWFFKGFRLIRGPLLGPHLERARAKVPSDPMLDGSAAELFS
jgi:hypothetical protein